MSVPRAPLQVEEFLEEKSHQERRGPAVETLNDNELFFIDKVRCRVCTVKPPSFRRLHHRQLAHRRPSLRLQSADVAEAEAKFARKRRREVKPLRSQLILDGSKQAKPVAHPPKRKPSGPLPAKSRGGADVDATDEPAPKRRPVKPRAARGSSNPLDIWGDDDGAAAAARREEDDDWLAPKIATLAPLNAERAAANKAAKQNKRLRREASAEPGTKKPPALMVDMAGCSFNPDREQHQDALAALVAAEMKKILAKELRPSAPAALLPVTDGGDGPRDALDELVVYEDDEEEEEGDAAARRAPEDANEIDVASSSGDEEEQEGEEGRGGAKKTSKKGGAGAGGAPKAKSHKDRLREARRRAQDEAVAAAAALKKQRRDIDNAKKLAEALAAEEAAQEAVRLRRKTVAAEKAASLPPKLSKFKFQPAPISVLSSDEVTGSLRQLAAFPMVLSDRFKAVQRRGLVEVRPVHHGQRQKRSQVEYEKGKRVESAVQSQAELVALQRQNALAKRGKTAAAAKTTTTTL